MGNGRSRGGSQSQPRAGDLESLALPRISSVNSDKFLSHSVLQFPCLSNADSNSTSLRGIVKMKES